MALSKKQNKRLGAILSVMFKEETPSGAIDEVVDLGFVEKCEAGYKITTKGLDEKNRLCTLAGLNIKYASERKDSVNLEDKSGKSITQEIFKNS
mgnify:FL=1|tara:strand:- start:95 stop:376 length:282 start_codon:yes stop_codon:yes gene_type:complete